MSKHILITGVSSGIGYATARMLVGQGYYVFGSVRTEEDAERVRGELGVMPLVFDVTDHEAVTSAVSQVGDTIGEAGLWGLVNNAGISITGPLMHLPLDEMRRQFEVNLFGLLDVTQQCLPLLGARRDAPHPPGRIVNVSSISGRVAYPFMGAYAASKHALEALSDSLRRELMIYGIEVVVVEPGTTDTPIIDKASQGGEHYADTDYAPMLRKMKEGAVGERRRTAIPVEEVAGVIMEALQNGRPRTRYPVPRKWLTGWILPRLLPDRWLDRFAARVLGLDAGAD